MKLTTLLVEKNTRDELKTLGNKGDTYDRIIKRLVNLAHQHQFYLRQKKIMESEKFVALEEV